MSMFYIVVTSQMYIKTMKLHHNVLTVHHSFTNTLLTKYILTKCSVPY